MGQIIRQALKTAGKNQKWLAAELGVRQPTVSKYVRSDNLETATLARIYAVLPIPELRPLMEPEGDQTPITLDGLTLPKWVWDRIEAGSADEAWLAEIRGLLQLWQSGSPAARQDLQSLIAAVRRVASGRGDRGD